MWFALCGKSKGRGRWRYSYKIVLYEIENLSVPSRKGCSLHCEGKRRREPTRADGVGGRPAMGIVSSREELGTYLHANVAKLCCTVIEGATKKELSLIHI